MKKIMVLGIALFIGSAAAADYVAVEAGKSKGHIPQPEALIMQSFSLDETAPFVRLAVGHEAGWWGVEAGYSPRLSLRETHAVGTRPEGAFDIRQTITTQALDVRGRLSVDLSQRFSAHLFGGLAFVTAQNYERGYNTFAHTPVEWRNTMSQFAPEYGAGIAYRVNERITLTSDFSAIPHVAVSHWTVYTDIYTVSGGLRLNF